MLVGRQLRFARPALFRPLGAALLAAALALPVQAQILLVGNAEQTPVAGDLEANNAIANAEYSQEFTVGPGADFLLETVRIFNTPYPFQVTRVNYSVSVCSLDGNGNPNKSACTDLTSPPSLATGGIDSNGDPLPSEVADAANPGEFLPRSGNRFEVPSGTTLTLSASTTYSLYIDIDSDITRGDDYGNFHTTTSDDEDNGIASGWKLADEVELQTISQQVGSGWAGQGKALRVRLFGTADSDALVSNSGQTDADGPAITGTYSQEFTTGANTGAVVWSVDTYSTTDAPHAVSVCDLDGGGDPDTSNCTELAVPSNFEIGKNTFTTSSGVRLSVGTSYSLHIVGPASMGNFKVVTSGAEDTGRAAGWSLANVHQSLNGNTWTDASSGRPLKVAINGITSVQAPATGAPTISGFAQADQVLTASTDGIMDANGLTEASYAYQWIRVDGVSETDIPTATSRTYMPVTADEGRQLKVEVTFRDDHGSSEEVTSAATATVLPAARACRTGGIWCATLTVARRSSTIPSDGRGYCNGVPRVCPGSGRPGYGSLSDTEFTVDSATYTVTSLRWGANKDRTAGRQASLLLGLDRDLPAAELDKLTLVVGSSSFLLDDAGRQVHGANLDNHYRWTRSAELGDYVIGQQATVDLLHTDGNNAPTFADTALTRTVQENSLAGIAVGMPIPEATDSDMDPLTYRMTGADAVFFDFDAADREIRTRATTYDFETRPSYTVTVHATDDRRGTDTVEVTINLTDALEQAVPASTGTAEYVSNLDTVNFEYGNTRAWPGTFAQLFQVAGGVGTGVYPLHSVAIDVARRGALFDTTKTYARVREAVRMGNALRPGAFVANLETPSSVTSNRVNHFTAPPGVVLTAGFYFVTLGEGLSDNADRLTVRLTDSDDQVGRPAWGIGNDSLSRMTPSQDWAERNQPLKMAVLGPSRPATGTPIVSGSLVVGQALTAVTDGIADADGLSGVSYSYQWIRVDGGVATDIEGAVLSIYTLTAADVGRTLRVKATFTDDLGNSEETTSPETGTVTAAGTNNPPAFAAATQMLTIAENAVADEPVGTALEATDADGNTVTYTMEGQDAALFDFNASTRQISTTTGVTYDFEARARYAVVVKASDGSGGEDTLVVGIELSNVDEPPAAPDAPVVERTPGSSTRLNVSWIPPLNTGPAVTDYDLRYCAGEASDCTMDGDFMLYDDAVGTGNSAVVKDLEPDTRYQVQVRAVNLEGSGAWSASGEARTFEAPEFRREVWEVEVDENADAGEVIYGESFPAADSDSGATLTYSMEGTDAEFFDLNAADREILTKEGVLYDAEARDGYTVTIRADDGTGGMDTLRVEIMVGNKGDEPAAPDAPRVTRNSSTATSLDVSWTEPATALVGLGEPIEEYDLRLCLFAQAGDCDAASDFTTTITGLTTTTATVTGLTEGHVYHAQVRATNDAFEVSEWSESGIGKVGNNAPMFAAATLTFTLDENTPSGQNVGAAIDAATDADATGTTTVTLTYSMEGPDAGSFDFDAATRQISTTTGVTYDFETKSSYTVVVRAADGDQGAGTVRVTINVTDVNEAPTSDNISVTMDEDTVYVFRVEDFPFMDADATDDALAAVDITADPTAGDLRLGTRAVAATERILARDIDDGDLTFTPAENASGSPYATFDFRVYDGEADSITMYTATINVTLVNDRPTSADTSVTMEENETYTFKVADFPYMDAEGGPLSAVRIKTLETAGNLRLSGADVAVNRDIHNNRIDDLVFTPETDAHGSPYATFGFQVFDGTWFSARTYTMSINVMPLEGPPNTPTVTPTPGVSTSLDVSWTSDNEVITGYQVEYCQGAASACTTDADFTDTGFSGTATTTTITGLTENTLYQVRVQSFGTADAPSGWSELGEASTGNPPAFAADSLTITVDENSAEDVAVGSQIPAAVDPGDTLTYSMEGTDAPSFEFDAAARQISTTTGVTYDYETRSSYTVTIRAVDSTMLADTLEVVVGLNNVTEPPGKPEPPTVTATADSTTSLDVAWAAPTNDTGLPITGYAVRWCVGEPTDCDDPATDFVAANSLSVTVTTATITGLAHSTVHQVQVRAANIDGDGEWSDSGSGRTNEPGNNAPDFVDAALTREVAENTAPGENVGDPVPMAEDDATDVLTYSMEGTDMEFFGFVAADRQIQTATGVTYDHEARETYTVTIVVEDGRGGVDRLPVTISVTDELEPPPAPADPTVVGPLTSSARLEVSWAAPEVGAGTPPITSYQVRWCVGDETDCPDANFLAGNILSATTTSATITGLSPNTPYAVQVRAVNDEGESDWSLYGEGRTIPNNLPEFPSQPLTRSIDENSMGIPLGDVIGAATDADNEAVMYTLEGDDAAAFDFDPTTLQISLRSGVTYDHETKSSYTVTIVAEDAREGKSTVVVTIEIADVEEPPAEPTVLRVTAPQGPQAQTDRLDVSWTSPENTGPRITEYHVRWCQGDAADCDEDGDFAGNSLTVQVSSATGTSSAGTSASTLSATALSATRTSETFTATITGLSPDTAYVVQVRAINDEGTGDWSDLDLGESRTARLPNILPHFTVATLTISIPENIAPDVDVGDPIRAAMDPDDDDDKLRYRMAGADAASFRFDAATRQISTTTGVTYDHATKPSYTVTIVAEDDRRGMAELTVIIELTAVTDEVAEAWLARFGRAAANQIAEAVGTRLNAPAAPPTQLSLGGSTLQKAALSGALKMLSGETAVDARQTLANSSFVLPLSEGEGGRWTAWGRGAYAEFDGEEGDVDLDGDVSTGTIGLDLARGDWLTGVAVSHSEGDGDSRSEGGGEDEMDIELSSVSPYAKVDLDGGLSVWGMAGYGEGDLERKRDAMETEVDLEMQMAAAGISGPVGSIQGKASNFGLTLKADALAVRMEADGEAGLPEVKSDAQRLRLLLSGAGTYALESGGALLPNMETGVRWDEGDAETGLGVEIGVGMHFADASGRFSADLTARRLMAHEESGYDEWGVSGSMALAPGRHGRGLSLRLESGYGPSASNTQELWSRHDLAGLAPETPAVFDSRLGLEMGYGFNGPDGRGAWTPYLAYQQGTAAELRVGTRLDLGETMRLELSALRRGRERQDIGFQIQGSW